MLNYIKKFVIYQETRLNNQNLSNTQSFFDIEKVISVNRAEILKDLNEF